MSIAALLLGVIVAAKTGQEAPRLFEGLPGATYHSCGCDFRRLEESTEAEGKAVFSSDGEGSAVVQVGGRVVTLSGRKPDKKCWPSRLGGRCVLEYVAKGYQVVLKLSATWVCPSGDEGESCEVVRLQGDFIGKANAQEEKFKVAGECGC